MKHPKDGSLENETRKAGSSLLLQAELPEQRVEMPRCFLGRRTLSKLYLMLHFGRMLAQHGHVRLDTVNPVVGVETIYDHNGIEVHEFPDEEQLHDALKACWHDTGHESAQQNPEHDLPGQDVFVQSNAVSGHHLVDLAGELTLPADTVVLLVTDPDRNSMEFGFSLLAATGLLSERFRVHRVYLDICESSCIGVRYLEGLLARHMPSSASFGEWYALSLEERNQAAILDNQHEDLLRLSRLSSSYLALLKELAHIGYGLSKARCTRYIRMADKPARRNRSKQTNVGR